jgi:glycosyltransferase involved in cell wall biosynthesis
MNTAAVFRLAKPHVVHVHNFGPLGLEAIRYARSHHVPVVATNHNLPENWTANFFRRHTPRIDNVLGSCFSRLLNLASVVVSPSATADQYLSRIGVTANRVVISNGVDTNFFCPSDNTLQTRSSESPLHIAHVGRLDREKSCNILVAAVARASLRRSLILTVVGNGVVRRKLECQVCWLEVTGQCRTGAIRFAGTVSEQSKRRILQSSDLFVTASQVELQSIAILESMACGVAALGPNAGALPELCQPGQTGWLFQAGQTDDFARVLIEIDRVILKDTGMAARALVLSKHDAQATYAKYDSLLDHAALR